jgi:hypothetical protein
MLLIRQLARDEPPEDSSSDVAVPAAWRVAEVDDQPTGVAESGERAIERRDE